MIWIRWSNGDISIHHLPLENRYDQWRGFVAWGPLPLCHDDTEY